MPWLALTLFILEGVFSFFMQVPDGCAEFSIIAITLNAIVLILEVVGTQRDNEMRLTLYLGLVFRFFLLVWDRMFSFIVTLPNSGADTEMYAAAAEMGLKTGNYVSGGAYAYFVGCIYRVFGIQRPIAQYVNLLLSVCMILLVIRVLDELGVSIETQRTANKLLCLLPNLAITNVILLRETPIAFLITVSAVCSIRWLRGGYPTWLIVSVIASMVAATMHSGALAIVPAEAVFVILYDRESKSLRLKAATIARALLVAVVLLAIGQVFGDRVLGKLNGVTIDSVVEGVENSAGGSGYTVGINSNNNVLNFIVNTPLRMFYFVASPLPWRWRGASDIIAFCFSALFFLETYRFAFHALRANSRTEWYGYVILFLLIAVAAAFMFGWGVRNSGTALRHREKYTTIYVLLFSFCLEDKANRIERNDAVEETAKSFLPIRRFTFL